MKRIVIIAATIGILGGGIAQAGGGGCHTPKAQTARGDQVAIVASCITPTVLEADPGTAVRWISKDAYLHTITSGTGVWPEAELSRKDHVFSHTFQQAGLYPWYCRYHANMGGVVSVGGVSEITASTEPPARSGLGPVPSAGIATLLVGSMGFAAGRRRRIQD